MDIQEMINQEFKEFLKEKKISGDNARNNPEVLAWFLDKIKETSLVLYGLGGNYRDSTDQELLKAPGNEIRNQVWQIRDKIIPCAHDSLWSLKQMGGFEAAKDLIKLHVDVMNNSIK